MDLQNLQALGALVPNQPIKRTFEAVRPVTSPKEEWADPDVPEFTGDTEKVSFDVYIKRLSSADEVAIATSAPEDQTFVLVYRLARNKDGSPLFESVEQAKTLATWLLAPLVKVIDEVASRAPKKPSARRTPSGSKSRSRSAGDRRKSGKKQ